MNVGRTNRRREWKPGPDYRIVCDCQRHRRTRVWQRAARIASRGVAVLIGVPLAFGALFPSEAMNVNLASLRRMALREVKRVERTAGPQQQFRIFTTDRAKAQFLAPRPPALNFELVKKEFFDTQVPYGSIIYREAKKNALPPELVAAVIEAESDFRPHLVSNKKAQGLMQIVPETGEILGVRDPFNPEQNIAAGTRYLRYLLNRFSDQRLALAAYNAGEGKVEKCGCIPKIGETVEYLERVSMRANRYQARVHTSYLAALQAD